MRKAIALLVLSMTVVSWSEVSLGVNFHLSTRRPNGANSDFSMQVVPSLMLTPTERFEIVPKFGFGARTPLGEMDVTPDVGGIDGRGISEPDFQFIGGCGFFFRLIKRDPLRFSLGPDLTGFLGFGEARNNDFVGGGFYISLPFNLDFLLHNNFFIRTGFRAVNLGFHSWEIDVPNALDIEGDYFEFRIDSFMQPFMGFFFTF